MSLLESQFGIVDTSWIAVRRDNNDLTVERVESCIAEYEPDSDDDSLVFLFAMEIRLDPFSNDRRPFSRDRKLETKGSRAHCTPAAAEFIRLRSSRFELCGSTCAKRPRK